MLQANKNSLKLKMSFYRHPYYISSYIHVNKFMQNQFLYKTANYVPAWTTVSLEFKLKKAMLVVNK